MDKYDLQSDEEKNLEQLEKERELDKVIPGTTDYVRPTTHDMSNEELDELL